MTTPLTSPAQLTSLGILPIRNAPVRVAVGSPDGVCSNAWRVWSQSAGDIYISCRDNFKQVKVSLHASGRWRIGFTSEAIAKDPSLVAPGENRAWEVWDAPEEIVPGVIPALHMVFPTDELAVAQDVRTGRSWRDVVYVEASPSSDRITILSIFVTSVPVPIHHETERSFCLGWWDLPDGRNAQLIAHADSIGHWRTTIDSGVEQATAQAAQHGVEVIEGNYFYFWGHLGTGARYLTGAKARRT